MSKAFLLVLGLGLLSVSSSELTSNNYAGVRDLIQGFMDGYNARSFDLPAQCLSSEAQSSIDEAIVSMLQALLKRDTDQLVQELQAFEDDLTDIIKDCNLDEVTQNFRQDVLDKGLIWVFTNFFLNFSQVQSKFEEALGDAIQRKWYKSGKDIGEMMSVIVPLSSNYAAVAPQDFGDFLKGFLVGICKDPSQPGKCYTVVFDMIKSSEGVFNDVRELMKGFSVEALDKLYENAKAFYYDFKDADFGDCKLDELVKNVKGLNLDKLMANYFKNLVPINSSVEDLKKCRPNYSECGTDIGNMFKLIIGWSLD